ncbi:hypothetical protein Tco_1364279 [Tanacetum coccineum]
MTDKETNEDSVPKHSYHLSESGEDSMQLHELMNLCTNLSDRVLALETTKTTQALEIASLKSREDASKQGRSIEDIDKDAEVSLVDETQGRAHPKEVSAAKTLTTSGIKILVSTAAPSTTAVSPPVITEVEITLAQTLAELKSAKSKVVIQKPVQSTVTTAPSIIPKAKGITFRDAGETTTRTPTSVSSSSIKDKEKAKMVEPEVPLNKKDQIRLDEELEQEQGELTIEEKSKLFMELMNERKRHFAKLRAEEKRRKPLTKEIEKAFDKTIGWINNFKPMDSEEVKGSEKMAESSEKKAKGSRKKSIGKKRAGNEKKQESSKRQRMEDDKETEDHEEVKEDDEEGQKGFYYLIRADGSSNMYSLMIKMLQNINKEDLETLWKLVKTKHENTRLEDDYERVF